MSRDLAVDVFVRLCTLFGAQDDGWLPAGSDFVKAVRWRNAAATTEARTICTLPAPRPTARLMLHCM